MLALLNLQVLLPSVTYEESKSKVTRPVKVYTVVHLLLQYVHDRKNGEAYSTWRRGKTIRANAHTYYVWYKLETWRSFNAREASRHYVSKLLSLAGTNSLLSLANYAG
jgi:hypothetical protein